MAIPTLSMLPRGVELVLGIAGCFLLWTFLVYWIHRLSHIEASWNPLWRIHRVHHAIDYSKPRVRLLRPSLVFWFGSIAATADILISITLPLVLVVLIWPSYGIWLLPFHYLYEGIFSERILDHNPRITGRITRYLSIGRYHMRHHGNKAVNFSIYITLWDRLFRTSKL